MPGIGVVLNPHSKRYRKNPEKLKRMGFIVGDKGSFAPTNNLHDIRRVAEEFKAKEIDILALSGGDGTNHVTLTTFIQVYGDQPLPKITFLRGGTLNTIAFACGIFGSPEKVLANLLYKYHEDEPFETTEIDIMNINGKYGFIWGAGVIYNFMQAYYQHGIPSPAWAAWTLARSIGSAMINGPFACRMFERMDAEVTVDGKKWPFKNYSAIFAGSIEYLGLGFRVFYLAREPRKFHAISFSLPPRNVLRYVPLMFLGRPSGCPDLIEMPASEMIVQLAEPKGYTIDGDMHPPTDRFVIRTGPRLTVIVR
jgi:diacylglycerol kinase family enzyme